MTIFRIKHALLYNKIKMLMVLLMWPLMTKFLINGKSSMYDIGVVKIVAASASIAAAKDRDSDTFAHKGAIQETVTDRTTTYDKHQVATSAPAVTRTLNMVNKAHCNNDAATTIYGHFNENDNNSHKLSETVAKEGHAVRKMINMNTLKGSAATSSLPSPTSITDKSAEAIKTKLTSIPVPKNQLNEKLCDEISKNIKNEKYRQNTKDSKDQQTLNNNTNNDNNNITIDRHLKEKMLNVEKQQTENRKKVKENIQNNFATTFESVAHARQQLILKYALKWKQIPRVIYFTCKAPRQPNGKLQEYRDSRSKNLDTEEFIRRLYETTVPSLMLRVVLIDHLVNKNRDNFTGKNARERFSSAVEPTPKNLLTHFQWLEQILTPDTLRQIVMLDLNCGPASRRLLEMASNKAFFNSKYYWLLLEDYEEYTFNRQTEIDEAADIENKTNSYSYNTQADKSRKEDIVNDSNMANLQVKKLSTYPTDVADVFTSGSNPHDQIRSQAISSAKNSFRSAESGVDDRTPTTSATFNASRAGATDEDDNMEVIEKFLAKLNININTELMLAKRRRRLHGTMATTTLNTTSASGCPAQTQMPLSQLVLTKSGPMAALDYNSLQKLDYYLLYDVWNAGLQYGGQVNITECGNFTRREGLQLDTWFRMTSTTRRRLNMQLARIRCMVVITHKNRSDTLEEYLSQQYDTHLDSMNRFNFALLTHVRDLFNFSFILSQTPTWGYLKNGKFDGMIGALVRKQADIGGSPIFFRIERAKVIDYTTRTWVARPCFIFRHPSSTKKDRIVFLQPFSNEIWILLFAIGCLTVTLLWLLTSLEHIYSGRRFNMIQAATNSAIEFECNRTVALVRKRLRAGPIKNGKPQNKRQYFALLFESLIFYMGAICQQGLSFTTFFFSGRCIVVTSLLFAFAIYQFYSASIVGTLLMEKPKTIRTLRDLIHSSLEIGIEDIVYNRDYFLRTKDADAQELYAKKVSNIPLTEDRGFADTGGSKKASPPPPPPLTVMTDAQKAKAYRNILHSHETGAHARTNEASKWYEPEYGLTKLKKDGFAFHVDVATAYKIIADTFTEKEICELTEIQLFPPQKMVSIVQKGSPLRKAITYGLRRVTEVGLTDYQRKIWHSAKPRCVKQLHTDDLRVDMQTFASALFLLIFGYAASLLTLSLEIVHFKLWQRYTAQQH